MLNSAGVAGRGLEPTTELLLMPASPPSAAPTTPCGVCEGTPLLVCRLRGSPPGCPAVARAACGPAGGPVGGPIASRKSVLFPALLLTLGSSEVRRAGTSRGRDWPADQLAGRLAGGVGRRQACQKRNLTL